MGITRGSGSYPWVGPKDLFDKCLQGTRALDHTWGKRKAQEQKARLIALQAKLAKAQTTLELDPDHLGLQQEVKIATEWLGNFDKAKATWVEQNIQAHWLQDGDRCLKRFFKSFKGLYSSKQILALFDEENTLATSCGTSWEEMADIVSKFFKNSLGESALPTDSSHSQAIDSVLEVVSDKLTVEEKETLNAPLSIEELGEAALNLKKLRCPRPDGIPAELYQSMWTTVGPLLHHLINQGLSNEHFPAGLTLGMIVLLPKKNDQQRLSNKRLMTLLNVAYKIAAKAFQNLLSPILQNVISPQQFAFLLGRNIQHSLLLLGEMLQQAANSGGVRYAQNGCSKSF